MKQTKMLNTAILVALAASANSAKAREQTYIDPNAQISWLGQGVDSTTGELKGHCLDGDENIVNNTSAAVSLVQGRSTTQSLNEMAGSVGAGVNLGLFAGSASVSVHTRLEESTNTASLVYRFSYQGKDYSFDRPRLNGTSQSLVGNTNALEDACGDSYINHMQLGNDLYFVTQLTFADRADFREFVTQIRIRVLFWTRTETISQTFYDAAQSGVFSVKALSTNPLPDAIINLLGIDGEEYCAPSSNSDNSWMFNCQQRINDVLDYLLSDNPNPASGYNAWLADESNLGVSYYTVDNYQQTGISAFDDVQPSDRTAIASLDRQLLDELTEQLRLRNIIRAYANSGRFDSNDYSQRHSDVNANISRIELAMSRCRSFNDEVACQNEVNSAFGALLDIEL